MINVPLLWFADICVSVLLNAPVMYMYSTFWSKVTPIKVVAYLHTDIQMDRGIGVRYQTHYIHVFCLY